MPLDLSRLNILVIDDNPHMRTLVREILLGFNVKNVHECRDGSDALDELRQWPADIAIVDWMMEPLDGLDFTRLIRSASDSPNPFLPIIMLTGHTERFRVVEARDAGVTEMLAKPMTANTLYARLKDVIESPRPFIRTATYTGPDRRRRATQSYAGPFRRDGDRKPEDIEIDDTEPASKSG
jgi:two-component system chemotaxis response regulator CheY